MAANPLRKQNEEAMSAGAQTLTESSLALAGPRYDSYFFSGIFVDSRNSIFGVCENVFSSRHVQSAIAELDNSPARCCFQVMDSIVDRSDVAGYHGAY